MRGDLLLARATERLARAGIAEPRREAESLLGHALRRDQAWIMAHAEEQIAPAASRTFASLVARRARREPFAYVVGEKWFYGRAFGVTRATLVPRPETEVLIDAVRQRAPQEEFTLIDVGTGTGAIGLTVTAELPTAKTILYDVSTKALAVAKGNARRLKLGRRVRLARLDILRRELPEPSHPAVIVANLPYLPEATWCRVQPEVRREPKLALASGKDGLRHYRALFKRLVRWKRKPVLLAIEAEPKQFAELHRLAAAAMPDAHIDILNDLHGDARVLVAEK